MDFLKKLFLLVFLLVSGNIFAQDFNKQLAAFESSYANEGKGEYTAAIKDITEVYIESNYDHNLRLGWLYYASGRFTESLPYYQNCIKLKPVSIEARLGYVNPAASLGNWAQVEAQYNEILKIDPMNTTVNYRMGLLAYGREDYLTALRYLNKVLNLYPFDYDTVIMLAWTEYKLGKLREAKIMFQKALLIRPGDASATEGLYLIK